jgi:oligosaccharyltransferase complex subunit epsilon
MPPKSAPTSTPKLASQETSSASSNAFLTLWNAYQKQTPARLKLIDSYLVFIMLSGIIQFVYCVLVTNFPFNAFLAGYELNPYLSSATLTSEPCSSFSSCVGQFVLTASLRSQVNPVNSEEFKEVSPERYADSVILVT